MAYRATDLFQTISGWNALRCRLVARTSAGTAYHAQEVALSEADIAAIGGGAATIADGADVTQGALADAVVAAGAAGSVSAKLRRLTTDLGVLLGKVAGAAFGTAGTPSADVVSVQGVVSGTVLPVSVVETATRVSKTVAVTASQTGATVWDPAANRKFCITHLHVSLSVGGALRIFDGTDASGNIVTDGVYAADGGFDADFAAMHWLSSAADNLLKYTSGAGTTGFITAHGYETV